MMVCQIGNYCRFHSVAPVDDEPAASPGVAGKWQAGKQRKVP